MADFAIFCRSGMKAIFAVMHTSWAVVKMRPYNNNNNKQIQTWPNAPWTEQPANWEMFIMFVPNKPVKWLINDCEYMKIIHANCGWSSEWKRSSWLKTIFAVMYRRSPISRKQHIYPTNHTQHSASKGETRNTNKISKPPKTEILKGP